MKRTKGRKEDNKYKDIDMNDIQIFENTQFGQLRGISIDGDAWLMGTDVARRLGYSNPQKAIRDHVDEEDKTVNETFSVNGTMPILINESGFYALILSSKMPQAREFKHWVTSEVLPTIREHGAYMTQQAIEKALAEPDFLIQLAVNLKEERQKRLLAEQECEHQRTRIVELGSKVDDLQQEVTEMKDKVSYLDTILATKSSVLVTQIAQDYGESSVRFNRRLKDMNIQYQRGKQWILYADYKDCGYVTSETYLIKHKDGTEDVRMNTKWTQKGRLFLYEKLKSVGVIPVIERTTQNA